MLDTQHFDVLHGHYLCFIMLLVEKNSECEYPMASGSLHLSNSN